MANPEHFLNIALDVTAPAGERNAAIGALMRHFQTDRAGLVHLFLATADTDQIKTLTETVHGWQVAYDNAIAYYSARLKQPWFIEWTSNNTAPFLMIVFIVGWIVGHY